MNRKGFTLVELLAVIVILSLIALVAVPAITGMIKEGKSTLSDAQMKNVELAARNWASDKENLSLLNDDYECVTLETLQNSGYADMDLKNPKTGDPLDVSVKIERVEKNLEFTVYTGSYCS